MVREEEPEEYCEDDNTVAVINKRDEQFQELRRHYGTIVNHQTNIIRVFSQKNEILIAISIILLLLFLLSWFSFSDQCGIEDDSVKDVEKKCMNDHVKLNCSGNGVRKGEYMEICEELSRCLKDPVAYK